MDSKEDYASNKLIIKQIDLMITGEELIKNNTLYDVAVGSTDGVIFATIALTAINLAKADAKEEMKIKAIKAACIFCSGCDHCLRDKSAPFECDELKEFRKTINE